MEVWKAGQNWRAVLVIIFVLKLKATHLSFAFFRFACRGLFERHKLLFSFHMCAKILEAAGKLNMDEYSFFLRGGIVSHSFMRQ